MRNRWKVYTRLDRLARPDIRILGRPRSAFHVCGVTGLALGVALGAGLTMHRGLPLWVLAAVAAAAVATFLVLAMATKIVAGEERLVYYHHEVAILVTVMLVLWLLGQPVLAFLDATILGVGTFLLCGRIGCFMVGCCHGRPHRWGISYSRDHADAGFAPPLVGVRLFPIQLVESAWVFATVVVGVAMVLRGSPPGAALAWYVVVYDVGRFTFEFARGDASRPYRGGFSEGQWTSLLLIVVVAVAEMAGAIPFHAWHLAAAAAMAGTMAAVALHRRMRGGERHRLLSASHLREMAEAVDLLAHADLPMPRPGEQRVDVATTSAGLRLSAGHAYDRGSNLRHYTLSADRFLAPSDAEAVAEVLLRLRHTDAAGEVVEGREGTYHLIVRSAPPALAGAAQEAATR